MATFEQNITTIKQAQYGYQVRDAIAEGLEYLNEKPIPYILGYTEKQDADSDQPQNTIISIPMPSSGDKIYIMTKYDEVPAASRPQSGNQYYVKVAISTLKGIIWAGYRFGINMSHSIEKDSDNGSITITLTDSKADTSTRETVIKVTDSQIIISVRIWSTSELSVGLGTQTEFVLPDLGNFMGYSKFSTVVGSLSNITNLVFPFSSINANKQAGTFGILTSSSPFSFNGKSFFRSLQTSGYLGVAAEFHFQL